MSESVGKKTCKNAEYSDKMKKLAIKSKIFIKRGI